MIMNNKNLYRIANIVGWLLIIVITIFFISGYSMGRDGITFFMSRANARFWHEFLPIPFCVLLVAHIVPYYIIKKQLKKFCLILVSVIVLAILTVFIFS
jgi:uncharacterized membrane protein